jgi:Na+-driven multidrug efflux pump
VLGLYLPISYFLIALYESLRATLMTLYLKSKNHTHIQIHFLSVGILAFGIIAIFMSIFLIEKHTLFSLFNIPIHLQGNFYDFSVEMILIAFPTALSTLLNTNLYLAGKALSAMLISLFSNMLLICITYVIAYQLKMGLQGYVLSTLISSCFSALISAFLLKRITLKFKMFPIIALKKLWKELMHALSIFISVGLSYSVIFLGLILMNGILAHFGHDVVAGFGLAYRIQSVLIMPAIALSSAIVILKDSAHDVLRIGLTLSFLLYFMCSLLLIIFRNPLIDFFTRDPKIAENSGIYFQYIAPSYCALGPLICYLGTLEQGGFALKAFSINFMYLLLAFGVSGYVAIHQNHYYFLYEGIAIANWLGFAVIFILIMREGKYV